MEIDFSALLSNKDLGTIFVILICLANFILIDIQIVRRKSQFYLNPKLMIILSLAIGEVVFALFVLVYKAIMLFEKFSDNYNPCRLIITTNTYSYLINFVFGMGLVTLGAVELSRHRLHSLFTKPGVAIVMGGIPWMLGLVIVLPFCRANIDFDTLEYCYFQLSLVYYGVAILFPACLSVVALIISQIIQVRKRRAQQMTSSQYQILYHKQANPVYQPVSNKKHLDDVGAEDNLMSLSHQENPGAYIDFYFPNSQYPPGQQCVTQPACQQYNMQEQNTVYISTTQGPVITNSQATNTMSDMMKLLIIAIVFFLMVVPFQAFILIILHIGIDDWDVLTIVTVVLYWLQIARSCVTPFILATLSEF